MTPSHSTHFGLILILGLLSMLTALSIDMYLPSLPTIAADYAVSHGRVQMTLSCYMLGFAIGQILYGPMADSIGRKPVIIYGTLLFAIAGVACALAQSIEQLITLRFLHGFTAAAASVVINALMRDLFAKEAFSRVMSMVTLVMTIAPLLAPMMGGALMLWFGWHSIFFVISAVALLATILFARYVPETLPLARRQKFHLHNILANLIRICRHRCAFCYMLIGGLSFAGMFSFLSAGPFVYIELHGVSPQHFGYYFAFNILFLFLTALFNSRYVHRFGANKMLRIGLFCQFTMGLWLVISALLGLGFWSTVIGVACYIGCISMVMSNSMAVVLDEFPHMAGATSSLAGTIRFGISALVGLLLAQINAHSAWPMIISMFMCLAVALVLFLYASRSASSH